MRSVICLFVVLSRWVASAGFGKCCPELSTGVAAGAMSYGTSPRAFAELMHCFRGGSRLQGGVQRTAIDAVIIALCNAPREREVRDVIYYVCPELQCPRGK